MFWLAAAAAPGTIRVDLWAAGSCWLLVMLGGPVLKLAKIKFAPNAIFRVVSCLYIL